MRNLLVLGGLVLALLHPCGAFAQPDPRADSKAAKTPSGVRVGYTLILFGCEDAVVKAMGIEGQKTLNGPYLGTWHDIKGAKAMDKKRMEPLERGDFDMLLLATPHCFPNAETWANQLGLDSTPALLCDKGVMKNPKFRLVWQTWFWPTYEGKEEKKLKVPAATQPYRAEEHRALEKLADEVNKKHGRQVLVISPVAEATNELIKMVDAGKFPGLKDPSLLWKDADMWQPGSHLRSLYAYCNIATMYGVSPIGSKPDFSNIRIGGGKTPAGKFDDLAPITAEQREILQKIAWETVSKYRHSGVSK
jgi:hypothetical protein